ncbi:MAG: adenine-specific methyltransferase EcoRI family protein [Sodaliphilus pleomorphus]|uniref:adenine-specific methyltransferase EcoRI family protein n=1 Tax=Sodaliphilus pleomorphus TaxID=2606626 RepID=UPI0023EF7B9D|nr:adenine-specific methyltransferase EcoRI family protein [Sodaliphilus pleomorphus]MDD7066183.1 adenine-specific methyltransferase EcoRI family protein [Sodaliphilus pleomorphus]MDY2833334.1 adenine-specific methyltransferase EcoRI family protein [Sodaliphilus pleomorphus]
MANKNLGNAKTAKNDEFYTQLPDIEHEMQAYVDYDPNVFRDKTILMPCDDPEWSNFTRYFALNFQLFGIKKLISTSYAPDAKAAKYGVMPSLFPGDEQDPKFDRDKWQTHGRIFVLDRDINGDNRIDIDDLRWEYLDGDGDFRSREITQLRNEADFIITNPPFSLFREFLKWIIDGGKQFSVIGNMNAITYKEVFPLLKDNKIWLGPSISSGDREFGVPKEYPLNAAGWRIDEEGKHFIRVKGVRWYTNIEHGKRHEPLPLMTMADNLKFSRHKDLRLRKEYQHYDNYDAIEVPYTDAIPSDYDGVMGVPISFLDKYCPEQFRLLGITDRGNEYGIKTREYTPEDTPHFGDLNRRGAIMVDGELKSTYARILIQKITTP